MNKCGRLAVIATVVVVASTASGMAEELLGRALASGPHLLAISEGSANVSSEVTTQLAEANGDGSNLPETPAGPPGHERYTHAIAFAPCAENATLDCGTLTVPVDYREPFGDTVDIAIIRGRATNPTKRIGAIIGNPGGPGGSGVDFVLGIVHLPIAARLREYFDVVSFDPRGVGRSREVRCTLEGSPIPDDPDDATLIRLFDEFSQRYARACLEQNGSFAALVGTMNTARDMEMLRRALGERQITYAAGPYGSVLGAAYALYPRFFGRFFIANYTAPCSAWPSAEPVKIRDVHGLMPTPILVIGNDFDSRTTLAHARRLARALGFERNVLRYAGGGHTAFFRTTACVQDTAVEYLVELRVPPEGFTCPGQPIAFASASLSRGRSVHPAAVVRQPGFVSPLPRLRR